MALPPSALQKINLIKEREALFQQKGKEWKHCGKWIRCGITHYVDPAGKERTYEIVERTTRPESAGVDGVDVVTLMSSGKERVICLVVVYRAAVERFSIEFPAGLVNPGETLLQAAQRELTEETGYCGDLKSVSPIIHIDPAKSNDSSAMFIAEVASTDDIVPQKLDEDEYLETIELPVRHLRNQLDLLHKEHGFIIDARLYCFALGLEMGTNNLSLT